MSAHGRARRLTQTCDVTRNPAAGGSGVTAVVSGLACSQVWPADENSKRRWDLATTYRMFEVITAANDGIRDKDVLTIGARTYLVRGKQKWTPSRNGRSPLMRMVLELQR